MGKTFRKGSDDWAEAQQPFLKSGRPNADYARVHGDRKLDKIIKAKETRVNIGYGDQQ